MANQPIRRMVLDFNQGSVNSSCNYHLYHALSSNTKQHKGIKVNVTHLLVCCLVDLGLLVGHCSF